MISSAPESSTNDRSRSITRDALFQGTAERRFLGRNLSKADVSIYSVGGRKIAVKDYGARPLFVRHTLGRFLVRRECRAYQAAGPASGLAPFLGRLGPFTLATEFLEATPLADLTAGAISDEIFDALDTVIAGLHARGIAIADLHHRDVLVGPGTAVHVVDFAAACVLGPRPGPFRRRLYARLAAQDRLAAARMRARFTGRSVDHAMSEFDPTAVRLWGAGRRIKAFWDWLRRRRD